MSLYKTPPLPFNGNKRGYYEKYKEIIQRLEGDDYVFVDLFGGSGILSHWTKHLKPNSIVYYNDYDRYTDRLKDIEKTNEILTKCRDILGNQYKKNDRIKDEHINQLMTYLKSVEPYDYLTIDQKFNYRGRDGLNIRYYDMVKSNYKPANDYLNGLVITHEDYKTLYNDIVNKYNHDKIIFILDPPYMYNDKTGYNVKYWKLLDTLRLLDMMKTFKFIFFNSEESEIIDLMLYFDELQSTEYFKNVSIHTQHRGTITKTKLEHLVTNF